MIKKIYFSAFAAVALMGCNEKMTEMPQNASDEVKVTVSVPMVGTKTVGTAPEDGVNSLQIFVFNKYGVFENSAYVTGSTLTMTCTTGEKTIAALVNAPQEDGVGTLDALNGSSFDLGVIGETGLVMYGTKSATLTSDIEVKVPVTRIPARVLLNRVTPDFELSQHQNLSFEVSAVYLINVAGDASYDGLWTPQKWYNLGRPEESSPGFLYDSAVMTRMMSAPQQEPYETPHHFYCLPNNTDTKTRLVIETLIGDRTYYYPITLDKVESNKSYSYNVTLKHLGTDSPDQPLEYGDVDFTLEVTPWVELQTEDVIL